MLFLWVKPFTFTQRANTSVQVSGKVTHQVRMVSWISSSKSTLLLWLLYWKDFLQPTCWSSGILPVTVLNCVRLWDREQYSSSTKLNVVAVGLIDHSPVSVLTTRHWATSVLKHPSRPFIADGHKKKRGDKKVCGHQIRFVDLLLTQRTHYSWHVVKPQRYISTSLETDRNYTSYYWHVCY